MSMQDLLDYASNKKSNALSAAIVTYSGIDYSVIDLTTTGLLSIYVDCLIENGVGTRNVLLPGNPSLVLLTNTQFISIMRSAVNITQQMADVYSNIIQQILNSTLTTNGQIDSAWASAMSGYSSNRVVQPTIEALYGLINSMNPSATVHTPTRSIVTAINSANGFQVSSSLISNAKYDINLSCTATIGGASSVTVIAEIAPTNSSTGSDYIEYARVSNGQTITLAIALQSVQTATVPLIVNNIPAGYWLRLRSVIVGTASATIQSSRETY